MKKLRHLLLGTFLIVAGTSFFVPFRKSMPALEGIDREPLSMADFFPEHPILGITFFLALASAIFLLQSFVEGKYEGVKRKKRIILLVASFVSLVGLSLLLIQTAFIESLFMTMPGDGGSWLHPLAPGILLSIGVFLAGIFAGVRMSYCPQLWKVRHVLLCAAVLGCVYNASMYALVSTSSARGSSALAVLMLPEMFLSMLIEIFTGHSPLSAPLLFAVLFLILGNFIWVICGVFLCRFVLSVCVFDGESDGKQPYDSLGHNQMR